jgi:inner membrane protein
MYARALLARSGRAVVFTGGLGAVYGLLYVILREETLALLAGSWALFALLALVMFLTRKIDWASFGQSTKRAVINEDAAGPSSTTPSHG